MGAAFWSEWDGRGLPDAVAWTEGWVDDEDDALKEVRRLGSNARAVRLEQGWVGNVDEDLIYDACTEDGESLAEPDTYVDGGSVMQVTFAFIVIE